MGLQVNHSNSKKLTALRRQLLTMVKKKGKSKRTTLKDKYKIQRRVTETKRKRVKQGKKDAAAGKVKHTPKDPGIPNAWPFKQDLLKDIARTRERQQTNEHETKEKRKLELKALRDHQKSGGTARTVAELMARAQEDNQAFAAKSGLVSQSVSDDKEKSDGTVAAGQQSRRAYLRELKKVVDSADVLLQVLDSRDPIGSRMHPAMENAILSKADKRMVLVLNKIDLVPKTVVSDWLTYLRRSHPTIAVKASSSMSGNTVADGKAAATSQVPVGMDGLLQLLKNYARTGGAGGKHKTAIVVGIVGYPNTGKSSIINALKRTRAVGVSPRPGFTTTMQEVVLDRHVRLLDSPGIVFDDQSAMLGNCVDSESMADPIPPVTALLQRCNHASLLMTYNIPSFPAGDTNMFLALVAKSYGRVLKGGIPDKVAAARAVLSDWNSGKIPYYTAPPQTIATTVATEAVLVNSFGREFDPASYDEAVLSDLKDTDEVDFVKLDQHDTGMDLDEAARQNVSYLTGDNQDMESEDEKEEDDDDDYDEMDEEDDDDEMSRRRLVDAEDYDFNAM
jgi:nuclear GTP-binding protein